ncbi:FAD/NAD(P)-binding domain-containing protein [Sarocladium strictum]
MGSITAPDNEGQPSHWVPFNDQPLHHPRRLKVACIGAGFSGLIFAYKCKFDKELADCIDLTIYEKNADVGGTWLVNRYPGVACDVPAHIYTFPFEPNPNWSSFYAGGAEILQYIKDTAKKYGLSDNVQFKTELTSAVWDEIYGNYHLKLVKDGSTVEEDVDVLINGTGFLSKWSWPLIPGLENFKGKLVHTADWDESIEWKGKRVAVIGNGSSGIQVVSELQPAAAQLVNYIRGPTWISPNMAMEFTPEGKNFKFSKEQKAKFNDGPEEILRLRKDITHSFNKLFRLLLDGTAENEAANKVFREQMEERLGRDPELCAKLIPSYKAGCRRLSPGDGYLEALQQPNAKFEISEIKEVTATGIITTESSNDFDIIVCATGFNTSFIPPWHMVGKGGAVLSKQWADHPEAYIGACVPEFPNFFIFNGPNSPVAHGSLISVMDWTANYIGQWCKKIAADDIRAVAVKADASTEYNEYTQEALKRTVWTSGCRSWFKNGTVDGRVFAMYAGSVLHYKELTESFRTEDFEIEYRSKNRFRIMGNGFTLREVNQEDLAFYIDKP